MGPLGRETDRALGKPVPTQPVVASRRVLWRFPLIEVCDKACVVAPGPSGYNPLAILAARGERHARQAAC